MNKVECKPESHLTEYDPGDIVVSSSTDDIFILNNAGDYIRLRDGYKISKAGFMGLVTLFHGTVTITTGEGP
jgi:hypothetical protein